MFCAFGADSIRSVECAKAKDLVCAVRDRGTTECVLCGPEDQIFSRAGAGEEPPPARSLNQRVVCGPREYGEGTDRGEGGAQNPLTRGPLSLRYGQSGAAGPLSSWFHGAVKNKRLKDSNSPASAVVEKKD
ncbi:unnamed protein product [Arctogadus glacialis]